jgi:hypothetical protein
MVPDANEGNIFALRCRKEANDSVAITSLIDGMLPIFALIGICIGGILFSKFFRQFLERGIGRTLEGLCKRT